MIEPEKTYAAICPTCSRLVGACSAAVPAKGRSVILAGWLQHGLRVVRLDLGQMRAAGIGHKEGCGR